MARRVIEIQIDDGGVDLDGLPPEIQLVLGLGAGLLGAFAGVSVRRRGETPVDATRPREMPAEWKPIAAALVVLGLPRSRLPGMAELKAARNRAIRANHPDRGGTNAKAAAINEAFRVVRDAIQTHT